MSLFLRKQVACKFSFIKWKSPRWITTFWNFSNPFRKSLNAFNAVPASMVIFTYVILTEAARDCRYSMYCWIVENSVTFGMRVFFCCFHRLFSWIASCTDLGQPSTYCGDGLIMWIPFSKAKSNQVERTEFCWYIGAVLYLTKNWWLLRLAYNMAEKPVWLILYPAFTARYFKIITCNNEHIRTIRNVFERHKVDRIDNFSTLLALDFLIEIISPTVG